MFRRQSEMQTQVLVNCHQGQGNLLCRHVIRPGDSQAGLRFMHDDLIEPGCSIGQHRHEGEEEVYLVIEGQGTMILDGQEFPIGPGDVSLVRSGHSHGLINSPDGPMRLIVIGLAPAS